MGRPGVGDARREGRIQLTGRPSQRAQRRREVGVGDRLIVGGTLTSVATSRPSASAVCTRTGPDLVSRTSGPGPCRLACATAVAIVACPQNGTSASGLK